ncbi:cell division protein ZapA [Bacillus solimangrovi]|uniref:Cell division protein ZapA n=1 Tax=Bacillus solimangrovi TaxID=1305675 RepID=A0A1E5LCS8_9BACI|nr:cell division protein ZapA [Bacillus solimangrovi]OEH91888.1 cell division protein ZapA [Bacillus solimangrovi]
MSGDKITRTIVEIHGQQYTIVGDEDSSRVRMVASFVDSKMKEIHEMNSFLDTNKLAVLTAVNIVHDYLKLQNDYEQLVRKIEQEKGNSEHV